MDVMTVLLVRCMHEKDVQRTSALLETAKVCSFSYLDSVSQSHC